MNNARTTTKKEQTLAEGLAGLISYATNHAIHLAVGAIMGAVIALVGTSIIFYWRFDPTVSAHTRSIEEHEERISVMEQSALITSTKLDLLLSYFDLELPVIKEE